MLCNTVNTGATDTRVPPDAVPANHPDNNRARVPDRKRISASAGPTPSPDPSVDNEFDALAATLGLLCQAKSPVTSPSSSAVGGDPKSAACASDGGESKQRGQTLTPSTATDHATMTLSPDARSQNSTPHAQNNSNGSSVQLRRERSNTLSIRIPSGIPPPPQSPPPGTQGATSSAPAQSPSSWVTQGIEDIKRMEAQVAAFKAQITTFEKREVDFKNEIVELRGENHELKMLLESKNNQKGGCCAIS